MKRMLLAVAVLGVSLGLGACAGTKEAQRDVESSVPGLSESTTGVVTDVSDNMLTVRTAEGEHKEVQFQRSAKTELVSAGQPYNWTDLNEGTPVRVKFESEAGAEKASKIEVLTGDEAQKVLAETGSEGSWSKPAPGSSPSGSETSPSAPSGGMDDSMDHGTMDHESSGPMGGTSEPDSSGGDDSL